MNSSFILTHHSVLSWFPPTHKKVFPSVSKMGANVPLHVTLQIWSLLDLFINIFILANLVYCQKMINQGFFTDDSSLFPPNLTVRLIGFVALIVVMLGDIFNLVAIYVRSLTLLVFWQMSFMLYFILAYSALVASYIDSIQTMVQWKVKLSFVWLLMYCN